MKYSYKLIITDETEEKDIIEMSGSGSVRSYETCLKRIKRDVNCTIKEHLKSKE